VTARERARRRRRWLSRFVLAVLLVVLAYQMTRLAGDSGVASDDFVAYWSAARLLLNGQDPYDPDALLVLQRTVGWQRDEPMQMFYPPWGLAALLPLGMLPYPLGRLIWLLLNLAIVFGCCDALWRLYGGSPHLRWLAWLLGISFAPTLVLLKTGQVSGLMLLGVTAFLSLAQRSRWAPAGAATALIAIKPQVIYLFWASLPIWCVRERLWRVLAGGAAAGAVLTAVALALDADVFSQFLSGTQPFYWATPTIASVLRLLARAISGHDAPHLAFAPALAGLAWIAASWRSRAGSWRWSDEVPLLAFASALTTPYAWSFDWVLLLPGMMQVAAWSERQPSLRRPVGGAYAVVNMLALAINANVSIDFFQVWFTPALLAIYLWARQHRGGHS